MRLHDEGVVKISKILDKICMEHCTPDEVLMDNGTSFRSSLFQVMLRKWDIKSHYRNVYRSSDNGIVERIHRSIKRITSLCKYSIEMTVYWYNVSPKEKL